MHEKREKLRRRQSNSPPHTRDCNDAVWLAMKIDLDEVIRSVVGVDPDKLIHADLIKQRLAAIDHTPDHPVYSVLIQEALVELNEGNGSSREAISQFIASKYDVLPIIHSGKLIEQLDKLVRRKEVLFTSENYYVLPIEGTGVAPKLRKRNKRSRKFKQDHKFHTICKIIDGGSMQEDMTTTKEAHSVKQKALSEVIGPTNIQGCLQVQQIGNKQLRQELQLTTEEERQQKEVGISARCRAELSMHELDENKDLIMTSSSSQAVQNLDLGLLLQKFDYKKEMYVDSLKKVIALRRELSENIQYMSLVEESSIASCRPTVRELVTALQSETKEIFQSDIGSSSMQDYDLKALHLELHRVNLDFKDHALNCAERPLNSCSALTSPNELLELPNYDFVKQQPEVPKNGNHLKQEQGQDPAQLKLALEEKTCVKKPEVMVKSPFEDIPPGFGVMTELEQHKIVNQNCELTVTELEHLCQALDSQITLKGEEGKLQCERKRGVSSCDDPVDTRKTCLIELQKQREDSGAQMKKTSKSVSCAAISVHVQQPIEADVMLNEDDSIVVGSSRAVDGKERVSNPGSPAKVRRPRRMPSPHATKSHRFDQFYFEGSRGQPSQPVNWEERASSAGLPAKVKQTRRQLRPRASKSRGCDQSPVEVISSDVDVVLLPIWRSKRQKKSESPIQGDKRNLFSKDETQEHSRWLKKSRSQELVKMHQQQLQKELQSPPSQTGHCSGEDSEELLSVHKEDGQQDDPQPPSEKVPQVVTGKESTPEYTKHPRGRQQKLVRSADKLVNLSLPSKRGAKQTQGLSLDLSEVKPTKSKPLAVATASTRKIPLVSRESEGRITRARAAANEAAMTSPSPKCSRKQKLSERLLAPEQQEGADKMTSLQGRRRKPK